MDLQELLKKDTVTLVDVREPYEYEEGHVAGAINIPLGEVPSRVDEFDGMSRPLVLMCRSGARSGNATAFLSANGLQDVHNGGGWEAVQQALDSL